MKKVFMIAMATALSVLLCACGGDRTNKKERADLRREKMTQEEMDRVPQEDSLVTIDTALGEIQGIQYDGYREFRGVRYATAERWRDAVQTKAWEGTYDATHWGDSSWQYRGYFNGAADSLINQFYLNEALVERKAGYSDDSLNLNIWTPDGAENCPVLFYIHGGAFMTGSNLDTSTDGEAYTRRGVVTVAINYRLGPWANIYGDGYEGNLALTDQLTALHWVRDNIADYGGDPERITIMGESAGAVSVQNLLISPLVEDGLIHGAIMLSGGGDLSAMGTPTYPAVCESIWIQLKRNLGVEHLDELRDMEPKDLYLAWAKSLGNYAGFAATPILNQVSLTDPVSVCLDKNTVKNVPCIIGMLSEDMTPKAFYDAATEYGKKRAEAEGEPVYLYYFDRVQPGDEQFGAFHGADLYYAFGTLYRNWRPFDETDYRIAANMLDYISNFVKTGDPNGNDLPRWEPAEVEKQRFLRFGDDPAVMMEPDVNLLIQNQKERPAFPYAEMFARPDRGN